MVKDFDQFVAYVRRLPGMSPVGVSYARLADAIERCRPEAEALLLKQVAINTVETGPTDDEAYERWNEQKRRRANETAAAILKLLGQEGRSATPEERKALLAYTGFGGFAHIGVLPAAYPDAYVEGSKAWAAAIEAGEAPRGPNVELFRGLKDQYFTPTPVCRAMWALHDRAAIGEPFSGLEPSAGSGRFLWTRPAQINWTALEWDPLLVALLRALYPEATVLHTRFEQWAVERGDDTFDVVIGNPPYPRREHTDQQADRTWAWSSMAHAYFTARCATKLSPLGTMLMLTPLSLFTSKNYERERRELVSRCFFRGAAVLPSGTFPNVREGSFLVSIWTRRLELATNGTVTEREQHVAAGRFLALPEGELALCGGQWKPGSRGGRFLAGAPDLGRMAGVVISPLPVPQADIDRVFRARAGGRGREPAGIVVTPTAEIVATAEVDRAAALDERVSKWLKLTNSDPDRAEGEREALRLAVAEFVADVGNPYEIKPRRAGLRAVTNEDGTLALILTEPVKKAQPADRPPSSASPLEVVRWYCDRRGVATEHDLVAFFPAASPDDLMDSLLSEEDVFVEVKPDGLWWYTRETYLYSDLFTRLGAVDAALSSASHDGLRRRLAEQKGVLLDAVQPRVLTEIYVTPRSGFVPLECLRDWIFERTWGLEAPASVAGDEEYEAAWRKDHDVEVKIEFGVLKIAVGSWEKLNKVHQEWVLFLLAYWNRKTKTVDPNEQDTQRHEVYGGDVATRLKQEEALEQSFKDWLAGSSWAPAVEEAYNRAYRSNAGVEVSSDPVDLAGLNKNIRLRAHQNQAIRRASLGGQARSLLCAYDVGAGKCGRSTELILTNQGLVALGSLFGGRLEGPEPELILPPAKGLKVVAHVEGEPRWVPVRSLYRQRISDAETTVAVKTARGASFDVTRAHPFPVVRGGEVVWVPAGELVEGDDLVVPKSIPEPPDAVTIDDDLAMLLAWQIAEGHEKGHTAEIAQSDVLILERLLGAYHRLFGSGRVTRMGNPTGRIVLGYGTPHLEICDPLYEAKLRELGHRWGALSAHKGFPEWFTRASNHTLQLMLRAYFDAKGSAEQDKAGIQISSASRTLVQQLRYALLRFGVRTTYTEKWKCATNGSGIKRPYHYLYASGEDAVAFHENVGFGIPEKAERLAVGAAKERNPNVGIPVRDLLDELAEAGVTVKMLGFDRTAGIQSVGRATAEAMVAKLRYLASDIAVVRYANGNRWAKRTHGVITEHRDVLVSAADRLEHLLALPVRYERLASVTPSDSGGFVYDIEVDRDEYGEKNYVGGDGGLICHNTLVGLGTSQRWRQIGAARRPLIVVPASVLAKWHKDAVWAFPDANVGVIGLSPKVATRGPKKGQYVWSDDDAETRREKWLKFASGVYDITIVTHDLFLRDVEPDDSAVEDVLSTSAWFIRSLGKDFEERRLLLRRIAAAKDEIKRLEQEVKYNRELPPERKKKTAAERIEELNKKIAQWEEEANAISEPTDSQVESVRRHIADWISRKPYRRVDTDLDDAGNKIQTPQPGLVKFSELGCDALIVDEAHRYKNLWYPTARLGSPKIEYAGAMESGGQQIIVPLAWDMYFKCRAVLAARGGDGGILFLTATPVKNSPLELYSMISYLSARGWESRKISHKEEFIDRYWKLDTRVVSDVEGNARLVLAVGGFRQLDELNDILASYMDRKTIADLIALGIFKQGEIPTPVQEQTRKEGIDETADEYVADQPGPLAPYAEAYLAWVRAGRPDGAEPRAATVAEDPELATAQEDIRRRIDRIYRPGLERDAAQRVTLLVCNAFRKVLREALKAGDGGFVDMDDDGEEDGEDEPKKLVIPIFNIEGEQIDARPVQVPTNRKVIVAGLSLVQDLMEKIATDPRLLHEDMKALEEETAKADDLDEAWEAFRAGRGKKPKSAAYSDWERDILDLRLQILRHMNLPLIDKYYEKVKYPPKVKELAKRIAAAKAGCSHIVFVKYTSVVPVIRRALTDLAGIESSRIAEMLGSVDKAKRLKLSEGFNGRDEVESWTVVDGARVKVTQPAIEPIYDVIIGTDGAMSEGIDLQRRTCSIHHIDLPWEPATVQQRNGRGIRQGAQESEIDVVYYAIAKTFDGLKFGKVVGKQAWQETLFSGVKEMANPSIGMELDPIEADWYLTIEDDAVVEHLIREHRAKKALALDKELRTRATEGMVRLNGYFAKAATARDEATRESLWRLAMKRLEEHRLSFSSVTPDVVYSRVVTAPVAFDARTEQFFSADDFVRTDEGILVKVLDVQPRSSGYIATFRVKGSIFEIVVLAKDWTRAEPHEWDEKPLQWPDRVGLDKLRDLARDLKPQAANLWRDRLTRYAAKVASPKEAFPWWSFEEHLGVARIMGVAKKLVLPPLLHPNGEVHLLFLRPDLQIINGAPAVASKLVIEGYVPVLDWSVWTDAVKAKQVHVLDVTTRPGPRGAPYWAEFVADFTVRPLSELQYEKKGRKVTNYVGSMFFRRHSGLAPLHGSS